VIGQNAAVFSAVPVAEEEEEDGADGADYYWSDADS